MARLKRALEAKAVAGGKEMSVLLRRIVNRWKFDIEARKSRKWPDRWRAIVCPWKVKKWEAF